MGANSSAQHAQGDGAQGSSQPPSPQRSAGSSWADALDDLDEPGIHPLDVWAFLSAQHTQHEGGERLAVISLHPTQPATAPARTYTYPQLAGRSTQLALHLAACLGLLPSAQAPQSEPTLAATTPSSAPPPPLRVAVMMRNCVEVMEAHFAAAAIRAQVRALPCGLFAHL